MIDRDSDERNHWVYRNYDEFGESLYIGCSINPTKRQKEHRASGAKWLPYLHHTVLMGPYTYRAGRRIERQEIDALDPWWNETTQQLGERTSLNWQIRRLEDEVSRARQFDSSIDFHAEFQRLLEERGLVYPPNSDDNLTAYLKVRGALITAELGVAA